MAADRQFQPPWTRSRLAAGMLVCAAGAVCAAAPNPPSASQPAASAPYVAAAARNTVEQRAQALSKALALNDHQRAQLTLILEAQRVAIAKIWTDSSLLPAERAPATRAVQEHTADQIRRILNKEQKERYNPPKPISAGRDAVDVSRWLDLARASSSNSDSTP